jgi:hypothetical protein
LHEHVEAHDHGVDEHHDSGRTSGSEQCALDLVYSQVLGALHADYGVYFAATDAVAPVVIVSRLRVISASVPYDSRGPPAFS